MVCLFSSFICVIAKYRLIGELYVGSYWPLQVIIIVQSLIFLSFTVKENGCPFYCLWPWGYIYISVNLLKFVFLKPQLHVYQDKGFFFFFLLQTLGWHNSFLFLQEGKDCILFHMLVERFLAYKLQQILPCWSDWVKCSSSLHSFLHFLKDQIIRKASQECIKF